MKRKNLSCRIMSLVLCGALISQTYIPPQPISAFSAETTIDINTSITEAEIKDTTLLSVLRVIANYTKAQKNNSSLPDLTGNEDLLSNTYAPYQYSSFTFGDLSSYTGVINLTPYGDLITSIEGLGYARGASEFNLGNCTKITSIPDNEFGKCSVESIILSNKVTSIGKGAFQQCTKLSRVVVDGINYADEEAGTLLDVRYITKIGDYAFDGCYKLDNVTLYSGSREVSIGASAFSNCTSLKSISLPLTNATKLGEGAFSGCTSLATLELNEDITHLPSNIFSNTALHTIRIRNTAYTGTNSFPSTLKYIGRNAFQGANLGDLDFSKCTNLNYIGEYAFAQASISNISLPNSLQSIHGSAFNAARINTIVIPESVTTIEEAAFRNSTLSSITLPSSLKVISDSMFRDCSYLTNININNKQNSSKLEQIGSYAFANCEALENTNFLLGLTKLTTIGDYAFTGCCYNYKLDSSNRYSRTLYYEWNYFGLTNVTLPNSVTTIGDGAFSENYALESVNLGSSVTDIPSKAFYVSEKSLSHLQYVIVPSNLLSIGSKAFMNNSRLRTIGYTDGKTITIEPSVAQFGTKLMYIGENAFDSCSDKKTLTNVYNERYRLRTVSYHFSPEDIHSTFHTGDKTYLIYSESENELVEVYLNLAKAVTNPSEDDDVDTVYVVAQKYWVDETIQNGTETKYEQLHFGNESYGYGSFIEDITESNYYSESLRDTAVSSAPSIFILHTGTTKNSSANGVNLFPYPYTGLVDVILPDSMADTEGTNALGNAAFKSCFSLRNVTLSKYITRLPNEIFSMCAGKLTNWVSSADIAYTYYGLYRITNPNNLVSVGNSAFYNCYNLTLNTGRDGGEIGSRLETIGEYSYYNCKSIESIAFHSSLTSIGKGAFSNCAELDKGNSISYINNSGSNSTYSYSGVLTPDETNGNGLRTIDFTYAVKLNYIGSEAFSYTALKTVNLPSAEYTTISPKTFMGCTLLETLTIPENVKTIEYRAFQDCSSLKKLHMPASSVISSDVLYGAVPTNISALQMIVSSNDTAVTIPINQELVLPINCLSAKNRSGGYKVSVYTDDSDARGVVIYENGASVIGDEYENVLDVSIIYGNGTTTDAIKLVAKAEFIENLNIKVEANSSFPLLKEDSGSVINSQTFTYKLRIAEVPATDFTISGLTNNSDALYLSHGQAPVTLTANTTPSNSSDHYTWNISDTNIATLSNETNAIGQSSVTITPNNVGTTRLTITCGEVTKQIYLYVKVPISEMSATTGSTTITYSTDNLELPVGDTEQITLTTKYNNSSYSADQWNLYGDSINYTSSDPSIATVSSSGQINAIAVGTATITATALASKRTITYNLTVITPEDYNPLIGRSIDTITNAKDIYVGSQLQLGTTLIPAKATNKIKWAVTSGDGSITESGLLTAGATPSTITVKATMLGVAGEETTATKSISIKVLQGATGVNVTANLANLKMYVGNSLNIANSTSSRGYYLTPASSTDTVSCTSSNPGILSVTASGTTYKLTANAQGSVNLTFTATSGATTTIPVLVITALTAIKLDNKITVARGESKTLTAAITPATSNDVLTWLSSDPKIASVSSTGVVTGLSKGSCTITVSSSSGRIATCSVVVDIPAKKISLHTNTNTKKIYMKVDTAYTLDTVITPSDTTDSITYKSSKPEVASISYTGTTATVRAIKKGKTVISATTTTGKKSSITLYVVKKTVASKKVKITGPKKVKVGNTIQLTAKLTKASSTDTVKWSVSKKKLAKIDQFGRLRGIKKGTVKVTAKTTSGKKKTLKIKVTK